MTDLRADLDDFVSATTATETEPGAINTDVANRMLRRLHRLARKRAEIDAVANAEVDRIEAWRRDRLAVVDNETHYIERTLEGFMRMVHSRFGRKSEKLPNGTLKLTAARDSIVVVDDEAAAEWLEEHGHHDDEVLSYVPKIGKKALALAYVVGPVDDHDEVDHVEVRTLMTPDGETLPGVRVRRPTRPTFKAVPATTNPIGDDDDDTDDDADD